MIAEPVATKLFSRKLPEIVRGQDRRSHMTADDSSTSMGVHFSCASLYEQSRLRRVSTVAP